MKQRLDVALVVRGLVTTRSRAEDLIRRGFVKVDGETATKPGLLIGHQTTLKVLPKVQFVSRAGEKLYSVINDLGLNFRGKTVLDVGSSTGGFSDVSLRQGAKKIIAIELGTNQMDAQLRADSRIELHEKTDVRDFKAKEPIDMALIDVSFISLLEVLPSVTRLSSARTEIVAMVKPQFEAAVSGLKHKGVIKNDKIRREILKDFEYWAKGYFIILAKQDSAVAGVKGNLERFYKLRKLS